MEGNGIGRTHCNPAINLARDRVTRRNVPSVVVEIDDLPTASSRRLESSSSSRGRRPQRPTILPCGYVREDLLDLLKVKHRKGEGEGGEEEAETGAIFTSCVNL